MTLRSADTGSTALMSRDRLASHLREETYVRETPLIRETYIASVATAPDVRRRLWASFVQRAVEHASISRGWSIPQIAAEANVGGATIYRWLNGEWKTAPQAEIVERFCDALDIPTSAAFSILWPGKAGATAMPEPLPGDPAAEAIQRKLADPNVTETEKTFLRENLRMLASRGR